MVVHDFSNKRMWQAHQVDDAYFNRNPIAAHYIHI